MKLPDKMTPEEMADYLGVARQTVNRWIREQNWTTETLTGVKGGRARLIHIDERVLAYMRKTPVVRPVGMVNGGTLRRLQHAVSNGLAAADWQRPAEYDARRAGATGALSGA